MRLSRARDPLSAPMVAADAEADGDDWRDAAPWARTVDFEDGVSLTGAFVLGVESLPLARIAFAPEGRADDATLDLEGADGGRVRVIVEPASGRTRILAPEELEASLGGAR